MTTDLQIDIIDRLPIEGWDGREPIYSGNAVICQATGECPTIIQSITDETCQAILDVWDRIAKVKRLRQRGWWGRVMLNAMDED